MVSYCLYGTLLLCLRWTACPVQIRAHHHIDVYTDINQIVISTEVLLAEQSEHKTEDLRRVTTV